MVESAKLIESFVYGVGFPISIFFGGVAFARQGSVVSAKGAKPFSPVCGPIGGSFSNERKEKLREGIFVVLGFFPIFQFGLSR